MNLDDDESMFNDVTPQDRYDMQLLARGFCPKLVWFNTDNGSATRRCMTPISDPELAVCDEHAAEKQETMTRRGAEGPQD